MMNENNSIFEVYPSVIRTELDPKNNFESDYEYLLRSGRFEAENVRALINDWFSNFSDIEKIGIKKGLNSEDDGLFLSTFYEIYIHRLLLCLKFKLKPHPNICRIATHPDYLCKNKNCESFYLEITTSNEFSRYEINQKRIISGLLDSINEIKSPKFFFHVRYGGKLSRQPPFSKFKKELNNWVEQLDHKEISEIYLEQGFSGIPNKSFRFEPNFEMIISVIPKTKTKEGRIIGSTTDGFYSLNTKELIRKAIKKKSGKYGDFKIPYIIAINVASLSCDQEDVIDALFGSVENLINFDREGKDQSIYQRRKHDGILSRIQNTRISAVIISHNISPWNIVHQDICVYLNPWAKNPYSGELDKLPNMRVINKIPQWNLGCQPFQIFQLPENWPKIS